MDVMNIIQNELWFSEAADSGSDRPSVFLMALIGGGMVMVLACCFVVVYGAVGSAQPRNLRTHILATNSTPHLHHPTKKPTEVARVTRGRCYAWAVGPGGHRHGEGGRA